MLVKVPVSGIIKERIRRSAHLSLVYPRTLCPAGTCSLSIFAGKAINAFFSDTHGTGDFGVWLHTLATGGSEYCQHILAAATRLSETFKPRMRKINKPSTPLPGR